MNKISIHQHFKGLKEPRINRIKYQLITVILIVFCAILYGAEDWVRQELSWIYIKRGLNSFGYETRWYYLDAFNRVFAVYFNSCYVI
ncbi:transposase family protein [Legionella lytica]|uniref:Transposase family protein n=1 Tax=Legionella lytica TaxID=96232 RepID=A0ABY4Y9R5_9GAMM|nr:transposase family protein [Legionella lytica]